MVHISNQQFLNPADEFTPIPFWFWNDKLETSKIISQIQDFHQKGISGFVLHPRMGIPEDIIYLSDYFLELVKVAVEEASRLGMSVILYDEAMYPSGSAKGMVVKDNPEYASRGLKMLEFSCKSGEKTVIDLKNIKEIVSVQAVEKLSKSSIYLENTILLDAIDGKVTFKPPNDNDWSVLIFYEIFSEGTIRGINFGEDDGEDNAPPSADLLNPDAVKKFINLTHDRYYDKLKKYFGNTIIAMFTDEPDILGRNALPGLKPWTSNFLSYYKNNGNKEKYLPALWFNGGEKTRGIRRDYQKTINKKLTESYYKPISVWCEKHDISLTGHPENSDDIGLLDNFHIPGQDVVWRWVAPEDSKALEGEHSTAGKCSADAARHRGRRRNANEFLGVCGKESDWALHPGDMKWYMDWLFVRGVNMLIPHAFYYSIDGKARSHERPPDVGPNNLWWPYYNQFAQYIKRLSWLMTDSINVTSVAVLCEEDHLPWKIVKPLYENQVEFNYLEQSLLLSACEEKEGKLIIANQVYSIIIIEDSTSLNYEAIQKLKQFAHNGGLVITLKDAQKEISGSKNSNTIEEIVSILPADSIEVQIMPKSKMLRFSKIKKDGLLYYFFVNEGEDSYAGSFRFQEEGKIEKLDPWTGSIDEVSLEKDKDGYIAPLNLARRQSLIYCIDEKEEARLRAGQPKEELIKKLSINKNWVVKNAPVEINKDIVLTSWHKWKGMEYYSGTVTYENTFHINEKQLHNKKMYLDLGIVHEIANVYINNKEIGVKMWAPYLFELEELYLKKGNNTIRIDVTNSLANQMDRVSLDSGLIGPVTIEVVEIR